MLGGDYSIGDEMHALSLILFVLPILWIAAAFFVGGYAVKRGYPAFPVIVGALFFSAPLVLLFVALAPGRANELTHY